MKSSLSDEEMIRAHLLTKSDHCFETLYNRYVGKVYQQCLQMTKHSEQAEDFTHDIFLKAFTKLNAFQERSSFSTWLYSIAFNYCADQMRLSKRMNVTSITEGHEQSMADSKDNHVQEETLQLVKQALATLTTDEQTILRMKYEDGRTIDEIAQVYKIKPSAVKMRLKRSRERIYRYCQQPFIG
ncbi:RNA polymerase sigma factor [Spirosoma aerolatum]|uniref:RNA polymerase sigma factor n=1 Tax=Spirosoma aerolatum TaxID=1211326 RepID=UPI0009ADF937|nr:sigma-70 family RNA polymerase sigma factor [Spirosoma aerolatum]